jgi:predicted Zn-dependent protease
VESRVTTIAIAVLLAVSIACATNPVTGERQLALISEAQELEIGRSAAAEVQSSIGLVDDAELQSYVQSVGTTLAKSSHRPGLPWTFAVVDDPTPNAFALPGGYIFLTRGMMNLMNSEAELASVLGHEIGHVTARHSVTAISRQQLAQIGLGLGGVLFPATEPFGQAIGAGLELLLLKHGRDAERQADELGFRYALDHDYAVREMAEVFTALQRAGDEQRSPLPSWLSTHPAPAERIELVEQWIAALPEQGRGTRMANAQYLEQLDGLVFGQNPRQGFFRDGVFYHPDLRFRFDIPAEWQAQNLPDAVLGISPNRDAALQLTIAGSGDPARAAEAFFSQGQGQVQVLRSTRRPINGVPAIVTVFDAATQQGVVRGVVSHLAYGGRTYQLLGYTPQSRFGAYDQLFEWVIASFGPVTDRGILDVRPARVAIVRISEPMTLREFSRRYNSSISMAELALINQAAGPETTFEAGTLLKRVVS